MPTKPVKKSKKRLNPTWTFQPDDDVNRDVSEILKELGDDKGVKTRLINEALRLAGRQAADVLVSIQQAGEAARRRAKGESPR